MSLLALPLTGCSDDFEQAAVTADARGNLQVVYVPCLLDSVERVSLVEDVNEDTAFWRVEMSRSPSTSGDLVFSPGSPPTGYVETIPLAEVPEGLHVAVYLQTVQGSSFIRGFTWGSLEQGTFLTDDGDKTREEFLQYAEDGCNH